MTRYFGIPFPGLRDETGDYSRYVNTAFAYLHRNMSATITFIFELVVYYVSRINITSNRFFFKINVICLII